MYIYIYIYIYIYSCQAEGAGEHLARLPRAGTSGAALSLGGGKPGSRVGGRSRPFPEP